MTEQDLLAVACEQFLGKSVMEIKAVVLQTLEGHLRSILGIGIHFILTVCLFRLGHIDEKLEYVVFLLEKLL